MTTTDKWVKERAAAVRGSAPWHDRSLVGPIEAALHDAIERGKAEQDKELAIHQSVIDSLRNSALTWRERALAAKANLARLENPDEATCRAVLSAIAAGDSEAWVDEYNNCTVQIDGSFDVPAICRALALTLTEGQENSE